MFLRVYIYPHYKVVVLKTCPGVIKLDPVLVFKYFRADGAAQLIQIQVELPAVLVHLCAGWGEGDGLAMFGNAVEETFMTFRLHLELADHQRLHYFLIVLVNLLLVWHHSRKHMQILFFWGGAKAHLCHQG